MAFLVHAKYADIMNDVFFSLLGQGEDASIEAAVMAISNCLREPVGPNNCSEVK